MIESWFSHRLLRALDEALGQRLLAAATPVCDDAHVAVNDVGADDRAQFRRAQFRGAGGAAVADLGQLVAAELVFGEFVQQQLVVRHV